MEKRLRIEFIVGIAVTVGGYVYYAGEINQVVKHIEGRLAKVEMMAASEASQRADVRDRITRIEGKQELTVEILNRVERQLGDINKGRPR